MRDDSLANLGYADLHMSVLTINKIVDDWMGTFKLVIDEHGFLRVQADNVEMNGR